MSALHRIAGTCVAMNTQEELAGVLIRGPSGSGKSDLALRLIDRGAWLIADDQVVVAHVEGRAVAGAPSTIRGLMEVRGIGIVSVPAVESAPLALVVELASGASVPRLPEPDFVEIAAVRLPRLVLKPFESSTPAKIRLAVQALRAGVKEGVTFPFAWQ